MGPLLRLPRCSRSTNRSERTRHLTALLCDDFAEHGRCVLDAIDEPNPVTDDSAQRALTDQLLVQLRAQAAPIALALGGVSVAVRVDPDARLWWMDAPPSASPPMRGQLLGMSFRLAGVVARCACVFEGFEPDEASDLWRLRCATRAVSITLNVARPIAQWRHCRAVGCDRACGVNPAPRRMLGPRPVASASGYRRSAPVWRGPVSVVQDGASLRMRCALA